MKKKIINISKIILTSLLAATIILGLSAAIDMAMAAWQEPTGVPPTGNVAAPINTDGSVQEKTGMLNIDIGGIHAPNIKDALSIFANSPDSAIYSQQDGTGYAGYFSGKMKVTGNTEIGGNTGIGIAPSASDRLRVYDNSTGNTIYSTQNNSAGYAGQFIGGKFRASGNTSIGSGIPTNDQLSVKTNSANSAIYAEQSGAGYAGYFSGRTAVIGNLEVSGDIISGSIISGGASWTLRTSAADNDWYSVTYGNGLFVAVSPSGLGNRVMTSPDGINWTTRNSAADNNWRSVAYGNGLFVAVSSSGNRVMTSPNGIDWTLRTGAADNSWYSVTYGNGLFVAVSPSGLGNRVMTSPDGINWTTRNSAADNNWRSVAYGNGLFVAVSSSGNKVMTSLNGINWILRTGATDNSWYSVTYGNGLFVAVSTSGSGNRVMTSPDGINWILRNSAADKTWRLVTYGGGLFAAVASDNADNKVMTSPDGINWTPRNSAANNSWYSVTYGNGLFVAVGAGPGLGNRVMTSGKPELNIVSTNNIYQGGASFMGNVNITSGDSNTDRLSVKANGTNSAIYAEQSGAGYAGYFSGKMNVTGNTEIGGNTGIGIAPSASERLKVSDSSAGTAIYSRQNNSAGYAGQFIGKFRAEGNTSIGSGVPTSDQLSVKTNSANSAIYAEQLGTGYAGYFSGKMNVTGNTEIGGNTGIGIAPSASERLKVSDNSAGTAIHSTQNNSAGYAGQFNGKFKVNGNASIGQGDPTNDQLSVEANSTRATIYAKQNNAAGYAGYFDGRSVFENGDVTVLQKLYIGGNQEGHRACQKDGTGCQCSWFLLASGNDVTEEASITANFRTGYVESATTHPDWDNQWININSIAQINNPQYIRSIAFEVANPDDGFCAGGNGTVDLRNGRSGTNAWCTRSQRRGTEVTPFPINNELDWIRLSLEDMYGWKKQNFCYNPTMQKKYELENNFHYVGTYVGWSDGLSHGITNTCLSTLVYNFSSSEWPVFGNLTGKFKIEESDHTSGFSVWNWKLWGNYCDFELDIPQESPLPW